LQRKNAVVVFPQRRFFALCLDSAGASGGYLSCFGKKDTKEADQGGESRSRVTRRRIKVRLPPAIDYL